MVLTFLCDFSMPWFLLPMCGLYHSDILLSLLFDEDCLPHNRQYKLIQGIWHNKLNHGYGQSQF